MKLLIVNGPNLNLLGTREPSIYGAERFDSFFEGLQMEFKEIQLEYFQSNIEGELINALQNAQDIFDGIIFNAAGYTHTSVSLGDTVAAISTPVIEVHISNVYAREEFRHHSYLSPHVIGSIIGFGLDSYRLALQAFQLRKK